VPAGMTLTVTIYFIHANGDLDLWLYDSDQNLLDQSVSDTDNEAVSYDVTLDGAYYILVDKYQCDYNVYDMEVETTTTGNNPPNTPSNPDPYDGETGVSTNPPLSVDVDDPDGDNMDILFYNASDDSLIGIDTNVPSGSTASITWSGLDPLTIYTWYTIADDGEYSTQSESWEFTTGEVNQPPNAPTIDGQTSGKPGTEYEYTFNATDPDGDDVKYYICWGDNTTNVTTDFNASGTEVIVKHTWDKDGKYTITAKAEDINGTQGPEETLIVNIPRSKAVNNPLLLRLFERFPLLERLLTLFRVI
jgi:hypothetical protein